MGQGALGKFTIPFSILLVGSLSYGSQVLFYYLDPGPLTFGESVCFNIEVVCVYICYLRSCYTDAGWVPASWEDKSTELDSTNSAVRRWCRKCEAYKPPRAHHCKICAKCVPKMDHHCPWTASCIGYRTMPHFIRFLFYGVLSMSHLSIFLFDRATRIWEARNLPSYLGPSVTSMIGLLIICAVNFFTFCAVGLLFLRNLWCLASNTTTIEGWEIDRHEALVRRARASGGHLEGPNGNRMRIVKQEFPYDIGLWRNISQGMGQSVLTWFWPFAASLINECGLSFPTNGFEDETLGWPPPDPDRISRPGKPSATVISTPLLTDADYIKAFRERQQEDLRRRHRSNASEAITSDQGPSFEVSAMTSSDNTKGSRHSTAAWADSDGDRLADFGVDDEIDFYDEDEVPLAELLERRRANKVSGIGSP